MKTTQDTKEGFYLSEDDELLPEGWIATTLGDLTHWASGGTPSKAESSYWEGTIPWISATSMNGKYIGDSELKITEEAVQNGSKIAKKGTLLFLVRGSGLYNTISFGIATRDVAFNQDVKSFTAKDPRVSHELLYYLLKGRNRKLRFLLEDTGIGAGKFDTERLKKLNITFPECDAERAELLATFKCLDNKIELLSEQNVTLEALAHTLFNRWFIDFNFPDKNGNPYKESGGKMVASELGEIPEGWNINGINSFIKRHSISYRCTQTDLEDNGKTQIFDQGSSGVYGYTNREPDFDASPEDPVILFTNHTCNYWLVSSPFCAIQNVIPYRGKTSYPIYWLYFTTKNKIQFIEYKGHWPDLEAAKFIIPTDELRSGFDAVAKSLCQKMFKNEKELKILTKFRDALLPKLMKGEIRIPVES